MKFTAVTSLLLLVPALVSAAAIPRDENGVVVVARARGGNRRPGAPPPGGRKPRPNQGGGNRAPAPAPAPARPAPAPAAPAAGGGGGNVNVNGINVAALAPNLGFTSGRNPTGTGDCDGAVNGANGQPIKIPCACPPSQADFVKALAANVAAGHPVNNPGIPFSFPTGNSNGEKIARIQAGLVTLQNLNGPGKGCPAVSSTLLAQQKALGG